MVSQVHDAIDLYIELTGASEEEAIDWLYKENEFLFGTTPFSHFALGDGQPILDFLRVRLNQLQGQGF